MINLNPNILSKRYATDALNRIFSEKEKIRLERQLWIRILKFQKKLGLDIPDDVIMRYEEALNDIDLNLVRNIELKTKHDVKARIEAFNLAAGGLEYIHMGMTSRDITDNVEQLQIKSAMELVMRKYVSVLNHLLNKAEDYKHIEITARTHHQAAQITILGRRFSMWAEELLTHLKEFETFIDNYPLKGIKGAVGTQIDMINLLGSSEKVMMLERFLSDELGFKKTIECTAQVYPRSLDLKVINHLVALSGACENFAKTMRLMAGNELVSEGFTEEQVGSSVMPHKMNPRSSERICALSELLKMYADGASRISGDQWEEGDVSCSAIRRVIIPDSFYTTDGIIETILTILNNMRANSIIINNEVDRYLPFLGTTAILTKALEKGIGREEAYNIIKKHAIKEALNKGENGPKENRFLGHLAKEPLFKKAGITLDELKEILKNRKRFIGNSIQQINAVKEKSEPLLKKYQQYLGYKPERIL